MGYPAYEEYIVSDRGVKYPKEWSLERLRFSILSNPVKSEVATWENDTPVSFVPMEAVGEYGGIDLSNLKPIGDVYGGYTYFADGDIVIAKITPCFENRKGAIAKGLKNGIAFGTTEFHVVRPLRDISKRWIFYLTMSDAFRNIGTSEMLGAGGQKRVPETFIKNFRTGIPPLTEQQKIADFLDWKTAQIDTLIAKKKQLIEKLREKRIALITRAVTKGLDPDAPMRDSGIPWLGEVSAHWEVIRLRYCAASITSGSRGWAKYFSDSGDLFLRITNLDRESVELKLDDLQRVEPPVGAEGARTLTKAGDLLISITADLGSVAVVPPDLEPAYVSQHLCLVRLDKIDLNPIWIANSILSHSGKNQLQTAGYGGTKIQLSLNDIKEIVFAFPLDQNEQKAILEEVQKKTDKIDSLIQLTNDAIATLSEYRTALITAATTGKIDVRKIRIPKTDKPETTENPS